MNSSLHSSSSASYMEQKGDFDSLDVKNENF